VGAARPHDRREARPVVPEAEVRVEFRDIAIEKLEEVTHLRSEATEVLQASLAATRRR
jgi:hypothetical protein